MAPENSLSSPVEKEKIRFDKKEILEVVLRLTAIVAAVVLMLAAVNLITKGPIEENNNRAVARALGFLFPDAEYTAIDIPAEADKSRVFSLYEIREGQRQLGLCIGVYANGFSSDNVRLMVGVTVPEFAVVGVEVISSSETPGIGATVLSGNGEFLNSFSNVSKLTVESVDSISGATVTSEAVKSAVLAAIDTAALVTGGDTNG